MLLGASIVTMPRASCPNSVALGHCRELVQRKRARSSTVPLVCIERAALYDLLSVLLLSLRGLLSCGRSWSRLCAGEFTDYRRSAMSTGRVIAR